jgi:hypothetical protein
LESLRKKLLTFNKALVKEYKTAINIINSKGANENRKEIIEVAQDLLSDSLTKSSAAYNTIFRDFDEVLRKYL